MSNKDLYTKYDLLLPSKFDGGYLVIALYEKIKNREIEEYFTQKEINEITTIKNLVQNNIDNNKAILKQLEKSFLLMEFNQQYLRKFLEGGMLTKKDLLDYYQGEDVKDKYRLIENEINTLK